MKKVIIIIGSFILSLNVIAQNCPPNDSYYTYSVGENKDNQQLKLPLNFIFSTDSIVAKTKGTLGYTFFNYKVIDKECKWNDDFSKGSTTYNVVFFKKLGEIAKAILIINFEDISNCYIEVQYENGQKRFFFIEKSLNEAEEK